jgi:hypothetical protein
MKKIVCQNCNCTMESGYLNRVELGNKHQPPMYWYNGILENKWYGYIGTGDKKLRVISYCCPRCKKIELYADENMED